MCLAERGLRETVVTIVTAYGKFFMQHESIKIIEEQSMHVTFLLYVFYQARLARDHFIAYTVWNILFATPTTTYIITDVHNYNRNKE